MTTSRTRFASSLLVLASSLLAAPRLAYAQDSAPPVPSTTPAPAPSAPPDPAPAPRTAPATPAPSASRAPEAPLPPAPWDASQTPPSAEDNVEPHAGFAMSLSAGYSIPFGDATGAAGDSLSATFSGQVPFSLEIGGNVTPSLFIGAYGTYAFGGVASSLTGCQDGSGVSCSAHSFHGGLAIAYRFLPGEMIRPWVGYGFGYESQVIAFTGDASGATGSLSITGWELGHFKGGFDVQASPTFAVGPFIDTGLGKYGHTHGEGPAGTSDADVGVTALHGWFTIGVRTTITP